MLNKFSIILPCFNEKDNLDLLIDLIIDNLKILNIEFEIIIVDDSSFDGTADFIKSKYQDNNKVIVINRNKERSLGKSIGEGINLTNFNNIIVMDADFNHNPDYLKDIIKLQQNNNFDMICCSRFKDNIQKENNFRFYASKYYNFILKPFLSSNINDQLSGFFMIKKDSIKLLKYNHIFYGYGDFYFRLIYFMNKLNKKIYEFPIIYEERKFGQSKTKFLDIFIKYTYEAIKFRIFLWIK
jgi:dolichol-phosphate mannosyltransferase